VNKKTTYTLLYFLLFSSYSFGQSDVISSLENAEQKIEVAENQRDTSILINSLINGIEVFSTNHIEDKALVYFGKLTTLPLRYLQAEIKMKNAYEAVAKIYCQKKEYFIAATYIERALKIAEQTQQNEATIQLSQQLCDILLLQKTKESQQKTLEKLQIIEILLEKNPNETFQATHFRQKASVNLLKKRSTEAIFSLQKALFFFEKNKNTSELLQCYSLLNEAFQQQNDPTQALFFLQKYNIEKEKIIVETHNIKDIYENRKKDKALIFNVENEKSQNKIIFWSKMLIGGLLAILVLAIVGFWIYRRRAKQKILLQNLNIQAMMNELKAFNYSVSHDLKSPLVEMFNNLSRIDRTEREKLSENNQSQLEYVSQTLLNTRKMIDEMLSYSITDNQGFEPQKFEMKELIEDILYQFSGTIEAKNIDVRVTPNFPQVYGDLAMIRQVFQNLISNGIKFSQNKPSPRIELGYKKENERIVFSVSDNGIGFDEQYKNKLFQLFKRLPTQEKFEGIGAGLAIVKRIVERHGGEVWAEGSPNQGAIFYFSLPKLS
jgi:signal transduction histidine kinase